MSKNYIFITVMALSAFFISCASGVCSEKETIKVTAHQLVKEFDDNAIAMEQRYQGYRIELSGKILKIYKNINQEMFVDFKVIEPYEFKAEGPFQISNFFPYNNIKCNFNDDQLDELIKLKASDQISTICESLQVINDTIYLKECKVVNE